MKEKAILLNLILFVITLILIIFKIFFSLITRSVALQADTIDNVTDLVMIIASLVGVIFANKKPNERFPLGYYRLENIISLVIAIFIFFTAFNIVQESSIDIFKYFSGIEKKIIVSFQVIIFLLISQITSIVIAISLKVISKKENSPIINSEAKEKFYDSFISLTVLIGFIGAIFGFYLLDSIFALIIVCFMIKGGYDIFIYSTKTLLDAVIDFDKRNDLYTLIEGFPPVKNVLSLAVRGYGKYVFLEIELLLKKEMPLYQIKELKDKLSTKIINHYPNIFRVLIIAQHQEKTQEKVAVPLLNNDGVNSRISDHFGESSFFAFLLFEDKKLIKFEVSPNKFKDTEKRKGILIADWLSSEKIDALFLKNDLKKGPKLVFENSLIDVSITNHEKINQLIADINKDD